MIKTRWKPSEEIRSLLGPARRVAVLSCGVCANLCGTGGQAGLETFSDLLETWGVEPAARACVNVCCSETIMREAVRSYVAPVLSSIDALAVLSCAGGVKSAFLCLSGVPVVAPLDTLGASTVSESTDLVVASTCKGCGGCVLTLTQGICPVSECPKKKLYGPCREYPEEGRACAVNPERECVWKIIREHGGNLEALKALPILRRENRDPAAPVQNPGKPPAWLRGLAARVMARSARLSWIVHSIR